MNKDTQRIKGWLGAGSINVFGMPFAGKDTQGRRLANLLSGSLLSGGDILRGSTMPERIKELMTTGELIPTKDYLEIVLPFLSQESFTGKPLVLSAVGRWHGEEPGVVKATEASGHPLRAVVFLHLTEDQVWKRWEAAQKLQDRGKRADDSKEALQIRLEEFRAKTKPVLDFYRKKNLLIEVDGDPPPDDVTAEILARLAERASE